MTREEAKDLIEIEYDDYYYCCDSNHCSVIDQIYDDFESRTCENCKHAQNTTVSDMENGYLDCNKLYVEGFLEQGFGCSLFERIEWH